MAAIDISWLEAQFSELSGLAYLTSGGQKHVLSAQHTTHGHVALKLLKPQGETEPVRRELLAVQEVSCGRVPSILDHGQLPVPVVGDCFWFVEQFVEGSPLSTRLKTGPLTPEELLRCGCHILEALAASESASIVHRDVKPDNIMLASDGSYWLLDFGIARHLGLDSLTATSRHFGKFTPGYAPPEQFQNKKGEIDARADLFATGVTLYECATGQNPYHRGARDPMEVLRRVEQQPLPRLSLSFPGSSEFEDLISALTQRRRDHRPASAAEAFDWITETRKSFGGGK